ISVAGSLFFFVTISLSAQDSTFVVTTRDPTYRAPAFIGNGAFSLVSAPLGTTAAPSFAAGIYDHGPGDVPRIAGPPAWTAPAPRFPHGGAPLPAPSPPRSPAPPARQA